MKSKVQSPEPHGSSWRSPVMLIFDQLKKNDPQLRVIAIFVLGGLSLLLAGLWWVQVVSARDYQGTSKPSPSARCAFPPCAAEFWTGTALCWRRTGPPTT